MDDVSASAVQHTCVLRHTYTAISPSEKVRETLSELGAQDVAGGQSPLGATLAHPFGVNALQLLIGERPYSTLITSMGPTAETFLACATGYTGVFAACVPPGPTRALPVVAFAFAVASFAFAYPVEIIASESGVAT